MLPLCLMLAVVTIAISLTFAIYTYPNAPLMFKDSWEHTSKEPSVLRHLERDCLKIFHGTSTLTGGKDNGWTIRCDYRRSEVLGQ